jgi:hypothetical protein
MILAIVGLVAAILGAALAYLAAQKRRRRRYSETARRHDLAYRADGPGTLTRFGFTLFDTAWSSKATHAMYDLSDPRQPIVFQYERTVGTPRLRYVVKYTCATCDTGLLTPRLVLTRENVASRLARAAGFHDIEVESPEFNDRWKVDCRNERFAVSFLDQPMIAFVLELARDGVRRVEIFHGSVLLATRPATPESMPNVLDAVGELVEHIPSVLADLYPRYR